MGTTAADAEQRLGDANKSKVEGKRVHGCFAWAFMPIRGPVPF
jgi:hypothetical protein